MFLVEMTVLEDGERIPLLYRTQPYSPVVLPLLYIAIRRRYQKSRTLLRDVRALRWLYHWHESVRRPPLDLEAHLSHGHTMSPSDIEVFVRWFRVGRPAPELQTLPRAGCGVATQRVLKPDSLNNYLAPVRSFLRWTVQRYRPERSRRAKADALHTQTLLIEETFDALKIYGKTPVLEKGLEKDQITRLRTVLDPFHPENPYRSRLRLRNALIFELLHGTGIRRGELLKLKVEDLATDEEGNCFISVIRRPDDPTDSRLNEPGQKTDDRIIAIHPSLHDALLRYIRADRRPKRQGRPMKLAHSFLFVSERGRPLAESQVNAILSSLAKRCFADAFSNLHPHVLRNTFCNEFIDYCTMEQGLSEEASKDRLRALCGWTATSRMPERYTRKRIQREANAFNMKRQRQARTVLSLSTQHAQHEG